jgi:hypothetical protein
MKELLSTILSGIQHERDHAPEHCWQSLVERWRYDIASYVQETLLTQEEAEEAERALFPTNPNDE